MLRWSVAYHFYEVHGPGAQSIVLRGAWAWCIIHSIYYLLFSVYYLVFSIFYLLFIIYYLLFII